jgi:hypothetical protein
METNSIFEISHRSSRRNPASEMGWGRLGGGGGEGWGEGGGWGRLEGGRGGGEG